jgi:hypothetical protein
LSFPLGVEKGCTTDWEDRPCLVVYVKLMQSFFAPVLPHGFGFAVIDDYSGGVYYHSNDQRSLLENFYIETDRSSRLIAAVQSRSSQFVSGIYNAQPHRFHVAPLKGTPWSLVVFYDLSGIEILNLRSVLVSLVYSVAVVVLWVLVALVTRLLFPRRIFKPLKTLLPNGRLIRWLKLRLHQRIRRIADNAFESLYVGTAITLVFGVFGALAWISFSDVSRDQVARMQRFNLLHSGQAMLQRDDLLVHETLRLGMKQSGSESIVYLHPDPEKKAPANQKSLSDFAVYYPHNYQFQSNRNSKDCEGGFGAEADDKPVLRLIEQGPVSLPVFNRFDANFLQMTNLVASDRSWCFRPNDLGAPQLFLRDARSGGYLRIDSNHPIPHVHLITHPESEQNGESAACAAETTAGAATRRTKETQCSSETSAHAGSKSREGLLFLALFSGFVLLYWLGTLTATRLMGLRLPEPRIWVNDPLTSQRKPGIETVHENAKNRGEVAWANLAEIAKGQSPELRELRAILYNRANDRIINTSNVTPVMWLILSGILSNENGLGFQDPKMKTSIRQQSWRLETREFFDAHSSDLWHTLAPSFYAVILLAIVLITMSGGKIGDFLIGIIPIALAGGIPAITNLVRERLK